MFKNALICHQECVCGKFMALKDPKIVPFKMIKCINYINLRPSRKISSLGVTSCLAAHFWDSIDLQTQATIGCYQ